MAPGTLFLGKVIHHLAEVDSTNAWLTGQLGNKPPEGTVVWTTRQTAGRGQAGNSWLGEADKNLAFSFLLQPGFLSAGEVFLLNKMVSLAAWSMVSRLAPEKRVEIKWPNDLLLEGKKVMGMLTENQFAGSKIRNSVIGVGLNLNQLEFGEGYGVATSLAAETGQSFEPEKVLDAMLEALEAFYLRLRTGRRDSIDRAYLQALWGYQEKRTAIFGGEQHEIIIQGVDVNGQLAVEHEGKLRFFQMKTIEFPR